MWRLGFVLRAARLVQRRRGYYGAEERAQEKTASRNAEETYIATGCAEGEEALAGRLELWRPCCDRNLKAQQARRG